MRSIGTLRRNLAIRLRGPWPHPEFVKAAHYFSDGWALNFWQVIDPARVQAELQQLVDDGFNTVILVIPWRGMQSDQLKLRYDPFYLGQLKLTLAAAQRVGLSVILRVGYSHQITEHNKHTAFAMTRALFTNQEARDAWCDYLRRIYDIAIGFRCYRGAFWCWEEFWNALENLQGKSPRQRRVWLKKTGFADYLAARNVAGVEAIPEATEDAYKHFHGFTNECIRHFYGLARAAFPDLSMEFRVDKNPHHSEAGIEWLSSDSYADLPGLRYSYWAPFMGAENQGEELGSERALELLAYMLSEISQGGENVNHVVDQFNFVDDTPMYRGMHAVIAAAEVPEFLAGAATLLRELSSGYGVWAWRDYRQNILFNPRFLMGMRGWQVLQGRARSRWRKAGIVFGKGAQLQQLQAAPIAGLQLAVDFDRLQLEVHCRDASATMSARARINQCEWIDLAPAERVGVFTAVIPVDADWVWEDGIDFELVNDGESQLIDNLYLYQTIFRGHIRSEDGEASAHLHSIQQLNQTLESA